MKFRVGILAFTESNKPVTRGIFCFMAISYRDSETANMSLVKIVLIMVVAKYYTGNE